MSDLQVMPTGEGKQEWVRHFIIEHWGDNTIVAHGNVYYPETLPGFIAVQNGAEVGLITYYIQEQDCEIVTLNSIKPSQGVGSALLEAVIKAAKRYDCKRVWLITTNDNLDALRFYQKRGFRLVSIHRDAIISARKLKPAIPVLGNDGIPILDELELELRLGNGAA